MGYFNLKNKRIAVTGSNGFIGKNLKLKLSEIDKKVFFPSSVECNLKSLKSTINYFDKINPEFVIHLAGDAGGIGYLKSNSALVFNNNTMMTSNLFSACKEQKTNNRQNERKKTTQQKRTKERRKDNPMTKRTKARK